MRKLLWSRFGGAHPAPGPETMIGSAASLLLLALLAGIAVGSAVGMFSLEGGQARELQDYVASRFPHSSFFSALLESSGGFLLLIFAATSWLGVAAVPILVFLRGYLLSCSVSAMYALYSFRGMAFALLLCGIPALLAVPCFYCAACDAFSSSRSLLRLRFDGASPRERSRLFRRIPLIATVVLFDAFYGYYLFPRLFDAV